MNNAPDDKVALVDLDGTIADYDSSMMEYQRMLQAPEEEPYTGRYITNQEPPYMEVRRKMIQRLPGFWRNLGRLPRGFEVVDELEKQGFALHVLTKGPMKTSNAWGEKVEWCQENLPNALVTVTSQKSLTYGRVLFDDYPPYFEPWLKVRPRGLVICLAHPWNEEYKKGGSLARPNIVRYDGTNMDELRDKIKAAYERKGGET